LPSFCQGIKKPGIVRLFLKKNLLYGLVSNGLSFDCW